MRERAGRPAAFVPILPAVLVLGLLAGCGTANPSGAPATAPSSRPSAGPASAPPATPTVRAYFGLGSTSGNPILAPVERPAPSASDPASTVRAALEALLAGPSDAEQAASPALFTAITPGTELAGVQIDAAGIATADMSEAFEETDELPALRTALAQVVVTLTQFAEVTGVQVTIKGAVLAQTDASGRQLERPATRADYGDQLGPIFVDSPAWGAVLHSPFRLGGLADVFEATFRFRLVDSTGRSLADGQLMASCGSGCLGTFGVDVPFLVAASTEGRLEVFDVSEADGSIADLVGYPVTLLP